MTRIPYIQKEYQALMLAHALNNERCALWAGMGLGKTSTALTLLDALFITGDSQPALALAPLRVARSTWPREAAKWEHLRHIDVSPVVGNEKQRIAALKRDVSVYTCNYDNLPWLVDYLGVRWRFDKVIADEATRLKNFRGSKQISVNGKEFVRGGGGTRARALGRIAHKLVKRFIELSGTPAPNGLKNLWGQAWFLDGGVRLGRTYDAFKQRWFRPSYDGYGIEPLPFAQEEIQDKLRDICLSLRAEDWFDVEEPVIKTIYVDLPPKARRQYREMEKEMFLRIESNDIEAFNQANCTMKCLQIASGFVWADAKRGTWLPIHDEKLQALDSIIQECAGDPLFVEYHWVPSRERILKAFPQARLLDNDPKTEDDWNAGKIEMLLASAGSAGHGLNLQDGGHILARYDHWWDLERYAQILERIGPVRQLQAGHPRLVFDYHIVARDTMDETVMARRESKRSVQDLLLEATRARR